MSEYYDLLGVAKGASADELKKAYRKQAMRYHPDRNPGDAEAEKRFKELSEAYDVLKDPQKRAAYDRYGKAAFEGGGFGNGGASARGGFEFSGFSDIFDEVFGDFMGGNNRGGSRAAMRGNDLRYNMDITLEEAFHGKEASIRIPTQGKCDTCEGTGAEAGTGVKTCGTCNGHGKVRFQQGFFTLERPCPTCNGAGIMIENPCKACNGQGRVAKERTLQVTIPAGVEDGTRIRLSGEGEAGIRGAAAGDLYIFLTIRAHRFFERSTADLYCRVPIPMVDAALGCTIEVPGVDGSKLKVAVQEGTQTGTKVRLRGKGMPLLRSSARGDLYIELQVETPQNLSKKQKELLKEFSGTCQAGKTSPQSDGFFSKVKELWQDLTE